VSQQVRVTAKATIFNTREGLCNRQQNRLFAIQCRLDSASLLPMQTTDAVHLHSSRAYRPLVRYKESSRGTSSPSFEEENVVHQLDLGARFKLARALGNRLERWSPSKRRLEALAMVLAAKMRNRTHHGRSLPILLNACTGYAHA